MVLDKGKKPTISEKTVEQNAEQIDSELVKVQEVQDELEKINEEESDKISEVEQKYNELRKPLYDKRSEIIKSIPDFWLTAFLSHPAFSHLLKEKEQKIFKHLASFEVEDCKDVKLGYSVSFNFSPNPFFENTKLTKTFTFSDEGTTEVTSTSIKWKESMGLANGDAHEKKRYKRDESFFSWFSGAQQKDESEVDQLIRGEFWTNPLTYFNNDADAEELEGNEEVSKMVADKGKKPKISEKTLKQNAEQIEKLQEVQDELEKINEEASDKVLEVEQKYNEFRKPLYDNRSEIIKSIPDFWLTAFLSHPVLSDLLNEQDEKIFKHLTSLEVEDCKDVKLGYSVSFNFSPNPFFEDTKLTKTFIFPDEGTTKVTATSIKWKEGMGLPTGDAHEKKGYNHDDSFLSWLSEVQQTDEYEVTDLIREDLWTNPLNYFNNDDEEELERMTATKRILKMARLRVMIKCSKVLKYSG